MKVALVTDKFAVGGGLEHLSQIVRGMPEVRFSLFAAEGSAPERFSQLENAGLSTRGYRPRDILGCHPDVVHFHHLRPLVRFSRAGFSGKSPPLVFTANGLHVRKYEFRRGVRNRMLRRCRLALERTLLARANRVIAVSRDDEGFLRREYGLQNTVYIPYGIAAEPFRHLPNREEARKAVGLPLSEKIFLTVARFDFQKGYDVLVRAIALGRETFRTNRVQFVFVGDGPELPAVRGLASRLGVVDDIFFAGARADVYPMMKASDLFVLPSRWEGLPIVLLEAARCGLPFVCSDACGSRELARESGDGLLFRNEDHADLCRVLSVIPKNGLFLDVPGSVARAGFLEKYDVSNMSAKLLALYKELAGQQGRPAG